MRRGVKILINDRYPRFIVRSLGILRRPIELFCLHFIIIFGLLKNRIFALFKLAIKKSSEYHCVQYRIFIMIVHFIRN